MAGWVYVDSTSAEVAKQFQRKSFIANGRRWVFYKALSGTDLLLATSLDGVSFTNSVLWAGVLTASNDVESFDVYFDGVYFHLAVGSFTVNTALQYRRGTPNSDGSVAWSAAAQTVLAGVAGQYHSETGVCVDSNGYPFIVVESSGQPKVIKSSTNNGTWATDTGFPFSLNATVTGWWTAIRPLSGGKVYVVYYKPTTEIYGRLWNGSSWGAEENLTGGTKDSNQITVGVAANAALDEVYVGYFNAENVYFVKRSSAGVWGTPEFVHFHLANGTTAGTVALSAATTGDVYVFFNGDGDSSSGPAYLVNYKKRTQAGVWDSVETTLMDVSDEDTVGFLYPSLVVSDQERNRRIQVLVNTVTTGVVLFAEVTLPVALDPLAVLYIGGSDSYIGEASVGTPVDGGGGFMIGSPLSFVGDAMLGAVDAVASGPKIVAIGQVVETDLAQPVTRVKSKSLGQVTETDLAQALVHRKLKLLGQPSETDLAQSIAHQKLKLLGQPSETDLAQAVRRTILRVVLQATETDLAQPVAHSKLKALGQATETDLAQPAARNKARTLGQPVETDLAQPTTHRKLKLLGQTTETDAAQPVAWNPKRRLILQASETDVAQPAAHRKLKLVAQALEVDAAQPVTGAKRKALGQALETDAAQLVTRNKARALGQPSEADAAQPLAHRKLKLVGQTLETDAALVVTRVNGKTVAVNQSTETDLAQALKWAPKIRSIAQAAETDLAQALTHRKIKALLQAVESDAAQAVTRVKARALGQTTETDLAQPLAKRLKSKAVLQVFEVDLAQPVARLKLRALGQASEVDVAQLVRRQKARLLGQALELDVAFALAHRKLRVLGQAVEIDTALVVIYQAERTPAFVDVYYVPAENRVYMVPAELRIAAVAAEARANAVSAEDRTRIVGAEPRVATG